jgi:Tfp pilus assembly PilM family ATPase
VIVYERCLAEGGLSVAAEALQRKLEVDAETALYLLSEVGLGDGPADLSEEAELLDEARALIGERVDELALEARASASYAGRRYGEPVARMLVAGEGGSIPGLGARLERKLDVPLRVVRLAELVPGSAGTAAERAGPSLVLALGLAQHREAWA